MLPQLFAAEEVNELLPARAKSVSFLYLYGGPIQLETWDMKPEAPENIRGTFSPIDSRTPDLRIADAISDSSGWKILAAMLFSELVTEVESDTFIEQRSVVWCGHSASGFYQPCERCSR